jgi:hypothetical protein
MAVQHAIFVLDHVELHLRKWQAIPRPPGADMHAWQPSKAYTRLCIAQVAQATFVSARDPNAAQRLDAKHDSVSF